MLLVYTHNLTPRVKYVFRQIFIQILNIEVSFTTEKSVFLKSHLSKISYTHSPLQDELFFQSHPILFEKGVVERNIKISKYDNLISFFLVKNSTFPFDPFGASFYMLSRYEEYLPHIKDKFGRFEAKESLAFKYDFLEKPVVDQWAQILKLEIIKKYPSLSFPSKKFKHINTIDVDSAYLYLEKGIVRTLGASIIDLLLLNYTNLLKRFRVILGFEKDPYDTFKDILNISKKYNLNTMFFFLLGDYSKYDKSISFSNKKFQSVIKLVNDYFFVGIHPSFKSLSDNHTLLKESERLQEIIHQKIINSRQHYIKLDLPNMYKNLLKTSIKNDYSMGFASMPGFRSGTSNSHFFYDLDLEMETDLKIHPFVIMDVTLKNYLGLDSRSAILYIKKIINEVKNVNGTFISIWHNQSLYFEGDWLGWDSVYENMIKYASELTND